MPIVIAQACRQVLLARAAASPGREICGLLFGVLGDAGAWVERADATRNVAASRADSFEIDPAALIAAHRGERAGGPAVIGCYHSHPRGPAVPSSRDLAAAEPGKLWLILGQGELRAWIVRSDVFTEASLAIV